MKFNKKGIDIGFATQHLATILLVLAILAVVLSIILVWANPALGESLKRFDFW